MVKAARFQILAIRLLRDLEEFDLILDLDQARPGDALEFRGPIGGYFAWEVGMSGPLLLVAGGSGIVPLMAMLRHRSASNTSSP